MFKVGGNLNGRLDRVALIVLTIAAALTSAAPVFPAGSGGLDLLSAPFRLERVLDHGERPDWSPDGKRLVFTESDTHDSPAYEIDLTTRRVRCLTCKWGVRGKVTRIYYLPDGNFLILAARGLAGQPAGMAAPTAFISTELYWLPASLAVPPQPLGAPAMGEIAHMRMPNGEARIAWGTFAGTKSLIMTATLSRQGNEAQLVERRTVYSFDTQSTGPGGPTFAETYGFARGGRAITFWSMDRPRLNSGMYELDIETGRTRDMSDDAAHNETHLFPNERFGLEESNRASDPTGWLRGISGLDAASLMATAGGLGIQVGSRDDLAGYAPFGRLRGVGRPFDLYLVSTARPHRIRRLTAISQMGGAAHQSAPAPDGRRIAFALQSPPTGPFAGKPGLYIGTFGSHPHR